MTTQTDGDLPPRSRAAGAADRLRAAIAAASLRPGDRLSEARIAEELGVSRNTLREAFRLLAAEGLVVHEPHKGVHVALPSTSAVIDIYRVRRLIEVNVMRGALPRHPSGGEMRAAVEAAHTARERGDWVAVGTANHDFHRAIVRLADSPRLEAVYASLQTELRLVFGMIDDPEYLHGPYVEENARICDTYAAGRIAEAAAMLEAYLDSSERLILASYARARA